MASTSVSELHNIFTGGKPNYTILHTNKIMLRYCLDSF